MFSVQETAVASYASARQKPARADQPSSPDDFGSLVDTNASAADTNRPATTDQPARSNTDDRAVTSTDAADRNADTRAARPDHSDQAAQNADDSNSTGSKDSAATPNPSKTASGAQAAGETKGARHAKKASETEAADQTAPATAAPTPSAQDASVLVAANVTTSAKTAAATDAAAITENTKPATSLKTSAAQSANASGVATAQTAITAQEDSSAGLSSPGEQSQAAAEKTAVDAKGVAVTKTLDDSVIPENAKTPGEPGSEDLQAAIPQAATLAAEAKSAAVQSTGIKLAETSTVKGSALTKADEKSNTPAKSKADARSASKTETGDTDADTIKDGNASGGDSKAKAAPDKLAVIHDSQPSVQPLTTDSAALQQASVQQPTQLQPSNTTAAPAAQLNATLAAANTPVPLNGLAADIALKAAGGNSRFEIRLDPAELGRIDVRLDVDKHGQVTSHLTVERPATLDMLRKDAPQLQQALEDAGLKTGNGGLQFSLRDQSSSSGQQNDSQSGRNAQRIIITEDTAVPAQIAGQTYGRARGSSAGVDISI
ncbi:MAG: flagellar hook-length control protein FliK [Bradyrhizobiaceae bacterium]|nr:MAG: flagellar hook-length control protein FliK [Bradyrhizobiaceae bacterium]